MNSLSNVKQSSQPFGIASGFPMEQSVGLGTSQWSHHLLSGKGALHRMAQGTEGPREAAPSGSWCMLTRVEDAC